MSVAELAKLIGQEVAVFVGGLNVNVRITDVKQSYGKTRYLVTPLSGEGAVWVESFKAAYEQPLRRTLDSIRPEDVAHTWQAGHDNE